MKFVELTMISDKKVWINPQYIQAVQTDFIRQATKVSMISGYYYFVKESIEEVIGRCEIGANH